jgi:surface antigen
MASFSDERLIAYLDGELEPELRQAIDRALAEDGALRERLRRLGESGGLVQQAFQGPLQQAVPARLLAAIEQAPASAEVAALTRPSAWRLVSARWGMALAASVALCIGLLGGAQLGRLTGDGEDAGTTYALALGAVPDRVLQAALDTQPSGSATVWQDRHGVVLGEIEPLLTFRAVDGRYCREHQVVAGTGAAALSVSCRQDGGRWQGVVTVAAAAQPDGVFIPASRASGEALDAAVGDLMAGIPFSAAEEARLIANRWR